VVIAGIGGVLNCANDLWRGKFDTDSDVPIEYAHVGLVDGPGNGMADYHAALLKTCALMRRCDQVSIHDHDGSSRAAAVAIMALHAAHRRGWGHWLGIIREKVGDPEFEPHPVHRLAFNRINWRLVATAMEE
jgi:hypothetical protein